jgi:hypothetical protein
MNRRLAYFAPAGLASLLLSGCAAPIRQAEPVLALTPLQAPAGARLYRLDASASNLRAVAFRAGSLARLGHHHLIEASEAEGRLWLPAQGLAGAQAELRLPLAALRLDEPAWRREAGGEYDERAVSAQDIEGTRRNLLAALRADAHPLLQLQLRRLAGAAPHVVAELVLSLAGRVSEHRAALSWRVEPEGLQIAGQLALSLKALGVQTPQVLGGLLAVDDALLLAFRLVWRAA